MQKARIGKVQIRHDVIGIGKGDRHVKKEVIEWNCEPRLKVF